MSYRCKLKWTRNASNVILIIICCEQRSSSSHGQRSVQHPMAHQEIFHIPCCMCHNKLKIMHNRYSRWVLWRSPWWTLLTHHRASFPERQCTGATLGDGFCLYWVPEQPEVQWAGWTGQLVRLGTYHHHYYAKWWKLEEKFCTWSRHTEQVP